MLRSHGKVGGAMVDVMRLAEQARPYVEAEDRRSALAILQAVTAEFLPDGLELDDSDGDSTEQYMDLGAVWTEAILTADLAAGHVQFDGAVAYAPA